MFIRVARKREWRAKWIDISQEMTVGKPIIDLRLKLTFLAKAPRPISAINEEIKDLVSFSLLICSILFIVTGSPLY